MCNFFLLFNKIFQINFFPFNITFILKKSKYMIVWNRTNKQLIAYKLVINMYLFRLTGKILLMHEYMYINKISDQSDVLFYHQSNEYQMVNVIISSSPWARKAGLGILIPWLNPIFWKIKSQKITPNDLESRILKKTTLFKTFCQNVFFFIKFKHTWSQESF